MFRLHRPVGWAIAQAYDRLGPLARRLQHVDWIVGGDPVFAGRLAQTEHAALGGFMYVDYAWRAPIYRRRPMIHIPDRLAARPPEWLVSGIVHELGHVLHEQLGWPPCLPVTPYAEYNRYEAFAEATVLYVYGWAANMRVYPTNTFHQPSYSGPDLDTYNRMRLAVLD